MGSWWRRLLVSADLPSPVTVGWSGIYSSRISKWFLNKSMSPLFSLLRFSGRRWNIWALLLTQRKNLPGFSDTGWCFPYHRFWNHNHASPAFNRSIAEVLARDQHLANLPDEYYLVLLSPSFLWVKLELLQFVPIAQLLELDVLYPAHQVPVDWLQLINTGLVWRGPQLRAVI